MWLTSEKGRDKVRVMRIRDLWEKEVERGEAPEAPVAAPGLQGEVPEAETPAVNPLYRIVAERPEVPANESDVPAVNGAASLPAPTARARPSWALWALVGVCALVLVGMAARGKGRLSWKAAGVKEAEPPLEEPMEEDSPYGYVPELYQRVYARFLA